MRKSILVLLLCAFTFIVVHDFVIMTMDHDTQTELVLYESGQLHSEAMCDVSKLHNHLHESLIVLAMTSQLTQHCLSIKTVVLMPLKTIIPQHISTGLYRPPIF